MNIAPVTLPQACENTDREIWRRPSTDPLDPDGYYQPSIHVTKEGAIGINVDGTVYVRSVEEWHRMVERFEYYRRLQAVLFEFKEALERSHR
jgi:hypothetical protein